MLETMRNASKGWLAGILILLLVASFGIWGVQDWMNLSSTPHVATVGHEEITSQQLQDEFNRFLREMARTQNTELSSAQAKTIGLDREALERMLTRKAIGHKAKEIGFNVSMNQVIDYIKAIPGMSDGAGGINGQAFQALLQRNNVSQDEFLQLVQDEMLREQLLRTVLAGVSMPVGMSNALNRFRLERRVVEYVLVDPSRAGEIKDADDATLRKYYEANAAARYSTAEMRVVTVVSARPADVESQVQISEDEIRKAYEANKRRFETPEKRTMQMIRFKDEAKARAGKAKLNAGETFEAVAKAEGLNDDDIKAHEVNKNDTTLPPGAFDIPANAISEPLKGPFGWVIVRSTSVTPGTTKSFEEARKEIHDKFLEERSKDKLTDLTNAFEDTLAKGATLEEGAKQHKLPIVKATIDARGADPEGKAVEGLPGDDFVQRVFAANQGEESELMQTNEGIYYEFRVDNIAPIAKKPFDSVRAQVLTDWKAEELEKRLNATAEALVKRGKGGESMAAIASSLGVAPLKSDPMPRYGDTPIFAEATVKAAGDAKIGEFFSGPVRDGKSIIVGKLAEIEYASEAANAPGRTMYTSRLREAFAGDIAQQLSQTVRKEVGVSIDEKRFQSFHTGE